MVSIVIEVSDQVAGALRRAGAGHGKTPAEIASEVLAHVIGDHESGIDSEIAGLLDQHAAEGRDDIAAGRFVEHAEVVRWLESWGKPDEIPPPRCD